MKKIYILIVLIVVSAGFINQINAQTPNSILIEKSNNPIEYQNANNPMYGVNFFTNTPSNQKVKLKSAQACQEIIDSIVYLETYKNEIYNGNKQIWSYDDEGNKIYETRYSWWNNAWHGWYKLDSTFNSNGNLSMIMSDYWNEETRQWETNEKIELTYDLNGDITQYFTSYWNQETEEWEPGRKQENTNTSTVDSLHIIKSVTSIFDNETKKWTISYRNELNFDSNGNMTLYNAEVLDSESANWVFRFKKERAYDENGNQTLQINHTWDSELNQWVGNQYENWLEWIYDEMGNETFYMSKGWNGETNQWDKKRKTESIYNDNEQKLQKTDYNWDSSNENWLAVNQIKNTYNENEVLSVVIECEWDNEEKIWVDISKKEFTYDDQENLTQLTNSQKDTISSEWYVYAKEEYKYNANNNEVLKESSALNSDNQWIINNIKHTFYNAFGNVILSTVYASSDEGDNLVKDYESEFTYNESGDKLLEEANSYFYDGIPYTSKTNYYYSTHCTTSTIDIKTEAPTIYPNPFSEQLYFSLNENYNQFNIELFDIQGRKVMSKRVLNAESINTSKLDFGIYIYKISFDGNIQTGKLMKK